VPQRTYAVQHQLMPTLGPRGLSELASPDLASSDLASLNRASSNRASSNG